MGLFTFFRKVKTFSERAQHAVREQVPSWVQVTAVAMVRDAEHKFVANEDRRDYVVKKLVALGVTENIARLAVELAVLLIKNQQV